MVCSDCHTQHNSADGQPMRTDNDPTPAPMLLRRGTTLELCLSCHDGSHPDVPDVIAPTAYASESAAGAFPGTTAHHLNTSIAQVPPGGTVPIVLTCTTCHDPHGNDNYRNLRPDPTKSGLTPVSILAIQTNGNIIYKSNVSKWCGQCHGAPTHHPVDKAVDFTIWAAVTLPRVAVLSPSDNIVPSADDQVICISCHKAHGSVDGPTQSSTCEQCHAAGAYKETAHAAKSCVQCHDQQETSCLTCHTDDSISRSAHARSQCHDCHDPHGVRDRDGVIPSMLVERPAHLCGNCHDGIRNALSESYSHAATCGDCHSAHKVIKDPAPSFADPSDYRLAGVSRVQVVNGGAGVIPAYRLVAADDPGDPIEREVCFKCHSSYAKQRLGRTDLARLMNPANASTHQLACSKCHDPHGSAYRHLLKKSPEDLCVECHSPTRFSGHAQHARVECTDCHDPHGSVRNDALIANRITSFIKTPLGGTCTSSCHGMRTYSR